MVAQELRTPLQAIGTAADLLERFGDQMSEPERREETRTIRGAVGTLARLVDDVLVMGRAEATADSRGHERSEEHTSELQSLMRHSYAVFCLTQKTNHQLTNKITHQTLI